MPQASVMAQALTKDNGVRPLEQETFRTETQLGWMTAIAECQIGGLPSI